ncbi:MAG: DUF3999 domain-containing protein [Treponema sp.]|jgi:hypothetical protein|nr:DUF3999 domain-containing protein [Treponema sp.]
MTDKQGPAVFSSLLPLFLLGLAGALSGQEAKVPEPEDFAGSLVLTGTPGGLLGFEIPEAVYQGIERPDMGDIRVFDEAGNVVPFVIRRVPGSVFIPPPEEVPFFRWEQEDDTALPASTDIMFSTDGTVLNIKSRGLPSSAASAYLLDLSGLSHTPSMLNIVPGKEEKAYHTGVQIYSSSDLARWRKFEKRQTLAWFGGGTADRNSLELPQGDKRYLLLKFDRPPADRLTPEGSSPDIRPRKITAVFDAVEIPPAVREKTIAGTWQGKDKRIAGYALGGFYPLTAIDFPLSQADSIEVNVKNKFAPEDEWSFVARTNLFRISTGTGEIRVSEALDIHSSAPFWELEAAGDVAFSAPPDCTIRWAVYELVFLGRGAGPWTLAWGSGDCRPQTEGDLKLPEIAGETGGPEIENARPLGEPLYRPRPRAAGSRFGVNWGQFILWTILILAVLFLSGLALYIARSMKKEHI